MANFTALNIEFFGRWFANWIHLNWGWNGRCTTTIWWSCWEMIRSNEYCCCCLSNFAYCMRKIFSVGPVISELRVGFRFCKSIYHHSFCFRLFMLIPTRPVSNLRIFLLLFTLAHTQSLKKSPEVSRTLRIPATCFSCFCCYYRLFRRLVQLCGFYRRSGVSNICMYFSL